MLSRRVQWHQLPDTGNEPGFTASFECLALMGYGCQPVKLVSNAVDMRRSSIVLTRYKI